MTEAKSKVIKLLEKKDFNVSDASLFYGNETNGVWFKSGNTEKASKLLREELSWDNGFENKFPITKLLEKHGWFCEPYDSETLFAYPI